MGEKIVNGGLFLLSLTYFLFARSLKFGSLSAPKVGFMPQLIGGVAVVVSGVLFVEALMGKGDKKEVKLDTDMKSLVLVILSIAAYILTLDILGYLVSSSLLLLAIFTIGGVKGWVRRIIISLISSGAFYVIFKVLLDIPLPKGILG
jgi:hypothetical protein